MVLVSFPRLDGLATVGLMKAGMARPSTGFFKLCPNIKAPEPRPWGDPSFIGLGFAVYVTILVVELFGAPLIRNCSVAVGLLVGAVISSATGFIDTSSIDSAPSGTFIWVKTFPLSVDGSLVLPLLACCVTTLVTCLGDVIATAEVSGIDIEGTNSDLDTRVQGGLTADGIWSVLSALGTSTPIVCFAQNNVITLPHSLVLQLTFLGSNCFDGLCLSQSGLRMLLFHASCRHCQ